MYRRARVSDKPRTISRACGYLLGRMQGIWDAFLHWRFFGMGISWTPLGDQERHMKDDILTKDVKTAQKAVPRGGVFVSFVCSGFDVLVPLAGPWKKQCCFVMSIASRT